MPQSLAGFSLAQRLRAGETVFSAWCGLASPLITDVMAREGFNTVTIDQQHGMWDHAATVASIAGIRGGGAAPVVRVPLDDFGGVSRALDWGAEGVIMPMINNVELAKRFVGAAKFPPIGERSWGPHRATLLADIPEQDIRTLHGVVMALAQGRKGPARGGVLDGEQAELLRQLLGERGTPQTPGEKSPVRGLAKLLRRNPTEAERVLWQALVNDRRFAGRGFKRQTPIGPHIADFVSFPLKTVIDLVPAREDEGAVFARDNKRVWLEQHGYKVIVVTAATVERDVATVLDALASRL